MMRAVLLLILLLVSAPLAEVRAADSQSHTLKKSTYKAVKKARKQIGNKNFKAAEATLNHCLEQLDKAPYDRAYVQNIYGYLHLDLQHYNAALTAFTQAYDSHRLDAGAEQNLLFNMAQLLAMLKRYDEAETRMLAWMKSADKIRSDDYMLLATIQIQLHHYAAALGAVEKAIASASSPVREQYHALYYLQYELKRPQAAVATLKKMIVLFPPDKDVYLQLSGLLLQGKDRAGALVVLELAYLQGMLKSNAELLQLAQLYVYAGVPLRAGQLLASRADAEQRPQDANWYMLEAQAWQQAREDKQALKAYAEAAAS